MPYFVNMVDRYRIRYYGKSTSGPEDLKAWLYLYGSGHEPIQGVMVRLGEEGGRRVHFHQLFPSVFFS